MAHSDESDDGTPGIDSIINFVVDVSHLRETLQLSVEKWRAAPAACCHQKDGTPRTEGNRGSQEE